MVSYCIWHDLDQPVMTATFDNAANDIDLLNMTGWTPRTSLCRPSMIYSCSKPTCTSSSMSFFVTATKSCRVFKSLEHTWKEYWFELMHTNKPLHHNGLVRQLCSYKTSNVTLLMINGVIIGQYLSNDAILIDRPRFPFIQFVVSATYKSYPAILTGNDIYIVFLTTCEPFPLILRRYFTI